MSFMSLNKWTTGALAAGLMTLMSGVSAQAAAQIDQVVLGNDADGNMTVKSEMHNFKAGNVTFDVINSPDSTMEHEMLVIRLTAPQVKNPDSLPYLNTEDKFNEDAVDDLGEVSELQPGKAGSLTVEMTPGEYMLVCNVAGHYRAKMYTIVHVK